MVPNQACTQWHVNMLLTHFTFRHILFYATFLGRITCGLWLSLYLDLVCELFNLFGLMFALRCGRNSGRCCWFYHTMDWCVLCSPRANV